MKVKIVGGEWCEVEIDHGLHGLRIEAVKFDYTDIVQPRFIEFLKSQVIMRFAPNPEKIV